MEGHRSAHCCIGVATPPSDEKLMIEMVAYVANHA